MRSLPFAFGDLTVAGHGTVTDVLPDGRVLGFGHSMDGTGPTSLPMATGYVNFMVPRDQLSFRVAGPLREPLPVSFDKLVQPLGERRGL